MFETNDHPSDIDLFYISGGKDGTIIFGEIKNERGEFKYGQRKLLEKLVGRVTGDAVALYIVHNKYWQNGDRVVNVMTCPVREIYLKKEGRWRFPKRPITVKEIIDYYREKV